MVIVVLFLVLTWILFGGKFEIDYPLTYTALQFFSSKPGKVHFVGLLNLLRYIRYNKNLALEYYVDIKDATLSDLFRQANFYRSIYYLLSKWSN